MSKRVFKRLFWVFLIIVITGFPSYGKEKVRFDSRVNPHDQINDEGEILYNKCFICHGYAPDAKKAKSIDDVRFRFKDLRRELCYKCHPERMHPGGRFIGAYPRWQKWGAPNHWVKPPKHIAKWMKQSLKKFKDTILPLDPNTGEITCPTCHNPHERGLLFGKADKGADDEKRLRDASMAVCRYCHAK